MNISILRYQIEQERETVKSERKQRYDNELLYIMEQLRELKRKEAENEK